MSANPEKRELCPKCGEAEHPMVPAPCRYNGWKNYETWCVHLWLSNEEGSYHYWREAAQDARKRVEEHNLETYPWTKPEHVLADRLKDEIQEEVMSATGEGMALDLMGAALYEVDWHEIADAFLED